METYENNAEESEFVHLGPSNPLDYLNNPLLELNESLTKKKVNELLEEIGAFLLGVEQFSKKSNIPEMMDKISKAKNLLFFLTSCGELRKVQKRVTVQSLGEKETLFDESVKSHVFKKFLQLLIQCKRRKKTSGKKKAEEKNSQKGALRNP
eukprot:Sdes_comp14724_c0_seq1m3559